MTSPEDHITKIRNLLTHEDRSFRQQGLELAKSLGDWSPVVAGWEIKNFNDFSQWGGSLSVPFGGLNTEILELVFSSPDFEASAVKTLTVICSSLETVDVFANLTGLKKLHIWLRYGNHAQRAYVRGIPGENFQHVDGLAALTGLERLEIQDCKDLQNVDGLANLTSLTNLNLHGSWSLKNIDSLATCTALLDIDLGNCWALENVDGLAHLSELGGIFNDGLSLLFCKALKNVDGLANLRGLKELSLANCEALQSLEPLANCTALVKLDLYNCCSLQSVDVLANFTDLEELSLWYCQSLQNVDALRSLPKLRKLCMAGCKHFGFLEGWEDSEYFEPANMTSREAVVAWLESQVEEGLGEP